MFRITKRKKNNNIILLPARMLWSKGISEFVECAKIVEKKNPKLKFILAGYPDYENPDAVPLKYLKNLKFQKNIDWIGNSNSIISLYKKTLIVLFPSHREGMPKTLLEASSCGIPIISFDVVGCREIVKDGQNGKLVPFGNVNLLAKNILELCDNKKLYSKLSKNGRHLVSKNYSSDIINNKILKLWE
jgi:glycosyltransferase involved in cell wall biosynthesis